MKPQLVITEDFMTESYYVEFRVDGYMVRSVVSVESIVKNGWDAVFDCFSDMCAGAGSDVYNKWCHFVAKARADTTNCIPEFAKWLNSLETPPGKYSIEFPSVVKDSSWHNVQFANQFTTVRTAPPPEEFYRTFPILLERCDLPCKCTGHGHTVKTAIIHLNDECRWTRERIADWLDSLDIDQTAVVEIGE